MRFLLIAGLLAACSHTGDAEPYDTLQACVTAAEITAACTEYITQGGH